jgi:low affinity Fe/Cu permease
MVLLVCGLLVLAITAVVFWNFMPRDGRLHRFATPWESYVGVAFCAAIALSMTMLLSGAIDVLGNP